MTSRFVRACLIVAGLAWAAGASAEVKILSVSGIVRVAAPGSDVYSAAAAGQLLAPGMRIATGENGRVAIQVHEGNVVRLRGNSRLTIALTEQKLTKFKLLAGRLKGAFARLGGGDRFDLEFASTGAIASVKGTTFTASSSPNGVTLETLFGDIDISLKGAIENVMQGCGVAIGTADGKLVIHRLSDDELANSGLGDDANGRHDLRAFQSAVGDAADQDAALVTQIREDDFAAGRTLTDVHGNLARVDQRLLRPDPETIQFLNLVKRDSYDYKGKFSYGGSHGARYDYLEGRIQFNTGLPDSVLDWPAFFVDHSDSIKAVYGEVTLANGKPGDATRDVLTRETHFVSGANDAIALNGVAVQMDSTTKPVNADGSSTGDLWATSIQSAYLDRNGNGVFDGTDTHIKLYLEAYALNASGKVLSLGDFTNTTVQDPLGIAKTISIETILSASDLNGTDILRRGNFDLVVIPDIFVAIAEKYAPSLAGAHFGN